MKTLLVPLCALAPFVAVTGSVDPAVPPHAPSPAAVTSAHQALRRVLESLPELAPGVVDFGEARSRLLRHGETWEAVVQFEALEVRGADALGATRAFTEWMAALGERPGFVLTRHQATAELEDGAGIVAHDVEILLEARSGEAGPGTGEAPEVVLRAQARRPDAAIGPLEIHRQGRGGELRLKVVPTGGAGLALAQVTGFLAAVDGTPLTVVECTLWRRGRAWSFKASVAAG